ncbi:MAG: Amidohydrolase family protein [Candidatus Electronema aureum]|jgi:cytosine/adenosine deaminase-related metal-dependent hydrolase|uniref:Amidohydrolase family protein n=1 Tax=Candidatus Electronema aureum TaxID=2005002 RepID=A0A521G1K8_9BACT|nr:MAG: Amidohydrolase family protein [Candidatus Electronema aureum]
MTHFDQSLDLLAFNLKLASRSTRTRILVSSGKQEDKKALLPHIKELHEVGVEFFATTGTSQFLLDNGVSNTTLHKIADNIAPNILHYLSDSKFDLVINILTGNKDYDEDSDSSTIRALCIENGIPIFTNIKLAAMTLERLLKDKKQNIFKYSITDPSAPWDMKKYFLQMVLEKGGFACYHAHFDKSYIISPDNLKLSQANMQKKWELYKYVKENYSESDLTERMSRCIEVMKAQGVTHCRTFIDADNTVKLLPMQVALALKEKYKHEIKIEIAVQPLEGVLEEKSRNFFEKACEMADVVGGLPSKDRPLPEKHLDIILSIAKNLGKPVDVHVDQENNPDENETELLALKAIEHGMEGRVRAVHSVSLAAKDQSERKRIMRVAKDAGLSFIVCPSAALSMKQLQKYAPLHNSIAPVEELVSSGLPVYLGADNIHDLFMPLVDGDMWTECRFLMEACRYYELETVANLATDKSGFSR